MADSASNTADPRYLRTFAAAAREEGAEETALVLERAADEIERLLAGVGVTTQITDHRAIAFAYGAMGILGRGPKRH